MYVCVPPVWPVGWGPCGLRGVWCQQCALPWTPGYLQCRRCKVDHGGGHSHECCWLMKGRKERRGQGQARWVKGAVWRSVGWTYSGSGPGKNKRGMAMMNPKILVSFCNFYTLESNLLMRHGQQFIWHQTTHETSIFAVSVMTAVTESFLQDQMKRKTSLEQFSRMIKNVYIVK